MTTQQELQMLSAYGRSADGAILLAAQRSEWADAPWKHRTFVLRLTGASTEIAEVFERPLHESWFSNNGTVYCPTNDGLLVFRSDGNWRLQQVCGRNEPFGAIFGFSGTLPDQDGLFVCGRASLFAREGQVWSEHAMPDDVSEMYRLHGLSADEVYICTDAGMYQWNGKTIDPLDGPDDEILDMMVVSSGEMIAVGERVHRWRDGQGWRELDSPSETHAQGMCRLGDEIFVPSRQGILKVHEDELEKVFDFASNQLVTVGGQIVGAGMRGGACVFDGDSWLRVQLPAVAPLEVV